MKRINYVMLDRQVIIEMNWLAYWCLRFGWRIWSAKSENKYKGLEFENIIIDEAEKIEDKVWEKLK